MCLITPFLFCLFDDFTWSCNSCNLLFLVCVLVSQRELKKCLLNYVYKNFFAVIFMFICSNEKVICWTPVQRNNFEKLAKTEKSSFTFGSFIFRKCVFLLLNVCTKYFSSFYFSHIINFTNLSFFQLIWHFLSIEINILCVFVLRPFYIVFFSLAATQEAYHTLSW